MISAIWAEDEQHLIGKNKTLPWHFPNDLKHFKDLTMGKTMVMGRVTYEGMGKKALPGRKTIVLTQDRFYNAENDQVIVMQNKAQVLEYAKKTDELMIIGGCRVFELFMDVTDKIYLTKIHHKFEGDTYMKPINFNHFVEMAIENCLKDEKNPYDYSYIEYVRK